MKLIKKLKKKPFRSTGSYEPDLHTVLMIFTADLFRSTGSYEPDLSCLCTYYTTQCFDPQALTSLTAAELAVIVPIPVSIHRLLRA